MKGFHIGKVFGIDINIDWSWLVIFGLIAWSLGSSFLQIHPEWTTTMRWVSALFAALLFFGSVLAHELAHSLVARTRKIPVRNITLFLFGGVASIQREPTSALSEFLIAIAGPLTSFALGTMFFVFGVVSAMLGGWHGVGSPLSVTQLSPLGTVFLWLGSVNVMLGLFNMIPGFPLDGGRVLRSILWGLTKNFVNATRWASIGGVIVAWAMTLAGVAMLFGRNIPFLAGGVFNGMWLIFIGWFLQNAATQSYRQVQLKGMLEEVPVKKIMNTDVPVIPADLPVETLIDRHMGQTDNNQAFMVFEGERMVGMVTLGEVRAVPEAEWRTKRIQDVMTPSRNLVVIAPEENASLALERLEDQKVRQLPVFNGSRIVGLLRRRDILRWLDLQSKPKTLI